MVGPYTPCSEQLCPGVIFEGRSQPFLYLLPKRTKGEPNSLITVAVSTKYLFEDLNQAKETVLGTRKI